MNLRADVERYGLPDTIIEKRYSVKLWHNTNDAPRLPNKVRSGQTVELWIGMSPFEPGEHVKVQRRTTQLSGIIQSGTVAAF